MPPRRDITPIGVHVGNDNRDGAPAVGRLKALYGPGDHGDPVLLPDED
jgi:hypothetical protein